MAAVAQSPEDQEAQVEGQEPVVEESEAEVAVETGDERLGAGREPEARQEPADKDGEHKPSRAALRRQAQRRYQQRLQRENEELRTTVQQLARGQNEIYQRLSGNEGVTLDSQLAEVDGKLQQANAILGRTRNATTPTAEQDFVEALNIRDQLVEARRNLSMAKQYREQRAQQPQQVQPQQSTEVTPKVRHAASFIAENSDWYDPKMGNRESQLAERLSAVLDAEGDYDPNTKEYWTELNKRVHAHPQLAHLFEEGGADDDDAAETAQERRATNGNGAAAAPTRTGGPRLTVAGRERPLKRGEVKVPRELKENMIEAGQWDDPKIRARVIARYQESLRAQRQQ
jgi:hypothetical protein